MFATELRHTASTAAMRGKILLTPGPTNVDSSVWDAMQDGWMAQKHDQARQLLHDLRDGIQRWLPPSFDFNIVIGGSGTAACESMLGLTCGKRLVVLENGRYSRRLIMIASRLGAEVIVHSSDESRPFDIEDIERAVTYGPHAIAAVWHETERGILNPIALLSERTGRAKIPLLLDAVSGVGAHSFELAACAEVVAAFSSNKALESLPGVGWVAGHRSVLERLCPKPPSLYLSVPHHLTDQDKGQYSFTPPVPLLFAANRAIELALRETYGSRVLRYLARAKKLRDALNKHNVDYFKSDSHVVTLLRLRDEAAAHGFERALASAEMFAHSSPSLTTNGVVSLSLMGALVESEIDQIVKKICEILAAHQWH